MDALGVAVAVTVKHLPAVTGEPLAGESMCTDGGVSTTVTGT